MDVYFDCVGGPLLDVVLTQINHRARIVICGMTSNYNLSEPPVNGCVEPRDFGDEARIGAERVERDGMDGGAEAFGEGGAQNGGSAGWALVISGGGDGVERMRV